MRPFYTCFVAATARSIIALSVVVFHLHFETCLDLVLVSVNAMISHHTRALALQFQSAALLSKELNYINQVSATAKHFHGHVLWRARQEEMHMGARLPNVGYSVCALTNAPYTYHYEIAHHEIAHHVHSEWIVSRYEHVYGIAMFRRNVFRTVVRIYSTLDATVLFSHVCSAWHWYRRAGVSLF